MRRAGGWLCIADPDAGALERDTFTCSHCQKIEIMNGRVPPGGFCRQCDAMICSRCVGRACVPFLKAIEAVEEAAYRRRQFEMLAGL